MLNQLVQVLRRKTPSQSAVRFVLDTCRACSVNYCTTNNFPTTCPGANYTKEGEEIQLKPDSKYPDWLWTLGEPKRDFKDMSPEVDGKAYFKRERKMKIREQNMIRKQRRF